ncbi:hypothetical protein EBB59_09380 [Lysobacter pythonis]|uniref:Uncharacterized protein n=1 Tax=Solilutibacter pythonis TaxID=2483112 RepID=A0A3M2HP74_9GAMM|nr:hypothetical protein EBB59_09380 [Lysobacter pythonis]
MDARTLRAQRMTGQSEAPVMGIDVATLGGMYAQKIKLAGTEGGVGVRNAGEMVATGGDFTLDSAGDVKLTGRTAAAGNVAVNAAGAVDANVGNLAGMGGRLFGHRQADIRMAGDYTHAGQNVFASNGLLGMAVSGRFINQATLESNGAISLKAAAVENAETALIKTGNAQRNSQTRIEAGDISNAGRIEGDGVALVVGNTLANTGTVLGNQVLIEANTLVNGRDLGKTISASPYNEAFIGATQKVGLRVAGNVENRDALIYNAGDISIGGRAATSSAGSVLNSSGQVSAEGNLSIATGKIKNERRIYTITHRLLADEERKASETQSPKVFVPTASAEVTTALSNWYNDFVRARYGHQWGASLTTLR